MTAVSPIRRPTRWIVLSALAFVAFLAVASGAAPKAAARKRQQAPPLRLPEAVMAAPQGSVMTLPQVDRDGRAAVSAAAEKIDALLVDHWKEHAARPPARLTDEQFARRIYLELGGRIPSYEEAVAFLSSKDRRKRAELIDRLLESPDYVSHFYNFWADILRLQERPSKSLPFEPYLYYVKEAIRTNKPYDTWVYEMLTADGRIWENPAVGYQLRDEGMPLPYVDNTVRVFLGTQIGCAQCHDHPFDQWTQKQFYELAALTAGTRMVAGSGRISAKGKELPGEDVRRLIADIRKQDDKKAALLTRFVRANATAVSFADAPLKLPHDYQYDDAEPLSVVSPKVLWDAVPATAAAAAGREQFAAWLVTHDNRQFARTIANRMWRKLMGVGLVEPVDDFRDENPASFPALLEHLTDEMLRLDFDLREFVRIIVSTDAYQRRAVAYDPTSAAPFRFTAPALRRMTAEQLWDSILTLVARNPWSVQRPTPEQIASAVSLDLSKARVEDVQRQCDEFMDAYGRGYVRRMQQICGYRGQLLVRASEIPTPLPLGHFLRQFGQSDREAIEAARQVATIPQILAMFNGPITHSMLERGSVIYDNVIAHRPEEAIDVVFLSVLSHRPSPEDRRFAIQELTTAEDPATGCGNVIWALLNTREFIFIQ